MTQAYPLQWPQGRKRTHSPEKSRFDVSFITARDGIVTELERLGAKSAVLSTNIELRLDGLPYANRPEPKDGGAAVYFTYKDQQMCFACDRWDKVKDNIQAIRHTISALRGIARWGTGDMLQAAFTGFQALPAPSNETWPDILGVNQNTSLEVIRRAFKAKYQQSETDEEKIKLNQAYQEAKKEKAV